MPDLPTGPAAIQAMAEALRQLPALEQEIHQLLVVTGADGGAQVVTRPIASLADLVQEGCGGSCGTEPAVAARAALPDSLAIPVADDGDAAELAFAPDPASLPNALEGLDEAGEELELVEAEATIRRGGVILLPAEPLEEPADPGETPPECLPELEVGGDGPEEELELLPEPPDDPPGVLLPSALEETEEQREGGPPDLELVGDAEEGDADGGDAAESGTVADLPDALGLLSDPEGETLETVEEEIPEGVASLPHALERLQEGDETLEVVPGNLEEVVAAEVARERQGRAVAAPAAEARLEEDAAGATPGGLLPEREAPGVVAYPPERAFHSPPEWVVGAFPARAEESIPEQAGECMPAERAGSSDTALPLPAGLPRALDDLGREIDRMQDELNRFMAGDGAGVPTMAALMSAASEESPVAGGPPPSPPRLEGSGLAETTEALLALLERDKRIRGEPPPGEAATATPPASPPREPPPTMGRLLSGSEGLGRAERALIGQMWRKHGLDREGEPDPEER